MYSPPPHVLCSGVSSFCLCFSASPIFPFRWNTSELFHERKCAGVTPLPLFYSQGLGVSSPVHSPRWLPACHHSSGSFGFLAGICLREVRDPSPSVCQSSAVFHQQGERSPQSRLHLVANLRSRLRENLHSFLAPRGRNSGFLPSFRGARSLRLPRSSLQGIVGRKGTRKEKTCRGVLQRIRQSLTCSFGGVGNQVFPLCVLEQLRPHF